MLRQSIIISAAILLSACYTAPDLAPSPQLDGNYVLDPEHTSVIWSVSHVGLSNYSARFDKVTGTLNFDGNMPERSQIDIYVEAASVSTGLPDFDKTIAFDKGYFDAKEHPIIRYRSTNIVMLDDQSGQVTGDLTFRGQTHPVTLDVTFNGAGKSFGHKGETLGFSATASLNRSDWGLTKLKNFGIGETVTLKIETEFNEAQN